MPRLLTLQGKIEMAKRTLELRKINRNKKQAPEPLTYQDADEAADVEMEEESEEEIEQIPISKTKRKKVAEDDEPEGIYLDDSVSDKSDQSDGESDQDLGDYDDEEDEEGGMVDVDESDVEEVEGGRAMRRLEESSSGDQEMEEYDESSEQ